MASLELLTGNETEFLVNGKDNVYIFSNAGQRLQSIPVTSTVETNETIKQLKAANKLGSVVCSAISPSSDLVAIADSEKRLLLFAKDPNIEGWTLSAALETEKRLLKIHFSCDGKHIALTDKSGDVWTFDCNNTEERTVKKLLGHCSVILDTKFNRSGDRIFTSDRDEKIRESRCPQGYVIEGYFLGHTEAVISINLIKDDGLLVSIDFTGRMIVWDTGSRKQKYSCELNKFLHMSDRQEVCALSVRETKSSVILAVKVRDSPTLWLFELTLEEYGVRLIKTLELKSSSYYSCWCHDTLNIATIESSTLKLLSVKVSLPEDVQVEDSDMPDVLEDVRNFVSANQSTVIPLKKLVGNEDPSEVPPKFRRIDVNMPTVEEAA